MIGRRAITVASICVCIAAGATDVFAQIEEARQAMDRGEYVAAVNILSAELAARPTADAYLYLGRPELHIASLPSVVQFADTAYLSELWRRQRAIGQTRRDPRTDPDQVRNLDGNVLVCEPLRRSQ